MLLLLELLYNTWLLSRKVVVIVMKRKDILIAFIIVIAWGLNFIAINLGLRELPPLLLGALRFLAVCVPIIFFLPRPPVSWGWLIVLGLSLNVGQFAFMFISMKVGMPSGLASLLMQAQAFFTLIFSILCFGERWQWHNLAGLLLAFGGMAVIGFHQGGGMTPAGFWLILLAAFCWGVGNIVMRRTTLGVPQFSMLSLVVWAGAVAIVPLAVLSFFIEGWDKWLAAYQQVTWKGVGSILYLAYIATFVGYGLWGRLLSRYSAAEVAPWALLVPIVGMSSSALLLGEVLTIWQSTGAILVMSGLVVHVLGGRVKQSSDLKQGRKINCS